MMERVNTFTHQLMARWHATADDSGASMVEYALLVGLIAIVAIVAVTFFGTELAAEYDDIASSIP
jgi:pilus assembly protein Flp/PilA